MISRSKASLQDFIYACVHIYIFAYPKQIYKKYSFYTSFIVYLFIILS